MEFGFVMKSIAIIGSGNWAEALSKILKPTKLIIKCRSIKKQKETLIPVKYQLQIISMT